MQTQDLAQAVRRMQRYIESHLNDPMTLGDLARASGYSKWYSARIFKDATGSAPFDYIRKLRLANAAWELREHQKKVTDVAFDFVFDSHEGFTRAFAKSYGMPPARYRRQKGPVRLFMPVTARSLFEARQEGKTMSDNKNPTAVFVQVVERPQRRLILKRGVSADNYYTYCEEVGCEVWEQLGQIANALHEPAGFWLPGHLIRPGTSRYVQGVEVAMDFSGDIPDGFEVIELPSSKIMIFQGEPYDDEQFEEAIGALWNLIDRFKPEQYGYRWADEDGPRFQLEPWGYRGYIEGRPVKAVDAIG